MSPPVTAQHLALVPGCPGSISSIGQYSETVCPLKICSWPRACHCPDPSRHRVSRGMSLREKHHSSGCSKVCFCNHWAGDCCQVMLSMHSFSSEVPNTCASDDLPHRCLSYNIICIHQGQQQHGEQPFSVVEHTAEFCGFLMAMCLPSKARGMRNIPSALVLVGNDLPVLLGSGINSSFSSCTMA